MRATLALSAGACVFGTGNPDARLNMQRTTCDGVADFLKVGQTKQLDIVLRVAAIRDRRGNRIKPQGFLWFD